MPNVLAAGNWDLRQKIDRATGFVLKPTGPLELNACEKPIRVEVWLTQKTTGAVQMTYQEDFPDPIPNPFKWVADDQYFPPSFTGGLFKPGWALGTAVAIVKKGNVQSYYWWLEEVELIY